MKQLDIKKRITELEKEIADLKKITRRGTLKEYLKSDLYEVSPISCLHHIARAKDGERVYTIHMGGDNTPIYNLAKQIFKFRKIDDLSNEEIKDVAGFCNEIVPICNKYLVDKYVANFDKKRFEEAYQDILDYLGVANPSAVSFWERAQTVELERILQLKKELLNGEKEERMR